jgi:hypothetical protein
MTRKRKKSVKRGIERWIPSDFFFFFETLRMDGYFSMFDKHRKTDILTGDFVVAQFYKMLPEAEKLLRKVLRKTMGECSSVDSFLHAIENVRQIGDSSDIAITAMALDCIEQNVAVMQDYLNNDSTIEIYEDMPVGNVIQAVMVVLKMDTLLMAGRIPELAKTKKFLDSVIVALHANRNQIGFTTQECSPTNRFYCLKVSLKDVHRPIWRRFVVPANIRLDEFHGVLQTVMGWANEHMHAFEIGNARKGIQSYAPAEWIEDWDDSLPEAKYTLESLLSEKGAKIRYRYDFGDNWEHEILLENPNYDDPSQPAPIFCIKGVGACPPEGCGGFSSFEDFCEVMANPKHPEYKEAKEWYGGKYDPKYFDLDYINEELNAERPSTPAKKTKRKATKKKTTT